MVFSLLAGVVGAASCIVGFTHVRFWNYSSLQSAASLGLLSWALTVLAMGLACQEISFDRRNAKLGTMEAFTIALSVTQLFYILAIRRAVTDPFRSNGTTPWAADRVGGYVRLRRSRAAGESLLVVVVLFV